MGWGEAHGGVVHGAGTTAQIAEAHRALDVLLVPPGPLALRILAATAKMHDSIDETTRLQAVVDGLKVRVERLENPTAPDVLAGLIADSDRRVMAEIEERLPPGTALVFDTSPLLCVLTEVVDGAAPNAVWCGMHHCFHPYASGGVIRR